MEHRLCTKQNWAPDFKKKEPCLSIVLTVSGRAPGHHLSDPRKKGPCWSCPHKESSWGTKHALAFPFYLSFYAEST